MPVGLTAPEGPGFPFGLEVPLGPGVPPGLGTPLGPGVPLGLGVPLDLKAPLLAGVLLLLDLAALPPRLLPRDRDDRDDDRDTIVFFFLSCRAIQVRLGYELEIIGASALQSFRGLM